MLIYYIIEKKDCKEMLIYRLSDNQLLYSEDKYKFSYEYSCVDL